MKEIRNGRNKAEIASTQTPPQKRHQKVMSLRIAARMLQCPKDTNFNYQLRVHTNLRGISAICETYNMSFLHCHDVME